MLQKDPPFAVGVTNVAAREVNDYLFTESHEKFRSVETDGMKRDVERNSWSVVGIRRAGSSLAGARELPESDADVSAAS